jgi:hypothetical protein
MFAGAGDEVVGLEMITFSSVGLLTAWEVLVLGRKSTD